MTFKLIATPGPRQGVVIALMQVLSLEKRRIIQPGLAKHEPIQNPRIVKRHPLQPLKLIDSY
ncbi:hypothetical protein D3C76_511540 [compost metagenome]